MNGRAVLVALVVAACGKSTASTAKPAPAPSQTPDPPIPSSLPPCASVLGTVALSAGIEKLPIVARSTSERVLEQSSFDHYSKRRVEVDLGDFVVAYSISAPAPVASGMTLRERACNGAPIDLVGYWNGGGLELRRDEEANAFVVTDGRGFSNAFRRFR